MAKGTPYFTRVELDIQSCNEPGCTKDHDEPLTMSGRCHPAKPVIVFYYKGGIIEVRCKVCNRFVSAVLLDIVESIMFDDHVACDDPNCKEPPENHRVRVKSPCHEKRGLLVSYDHGELVIDCYERSCGHEIARMAVAATPPPGPDGPVLTPVGSA